MFGRRPKAVTLVQMYPPPFEKEDEHHIPIRLFAHRITTRKVGPADEGTITQLWRKQA